MGSDVLTEQLYQDDGHTSSTLLLLTQGSLVNTKLGSRVDLCIWLTAGDSVSPVKAILG